MYRREFDRFVRTAAAIAGDVESGRDAVQEAFASAVRNRSQFRGEGTVEAWLWRAVVTRARNAARRRRPAHLAEAMEPSADGEVTDHDAALRAAIGALPERQRSVLFLRYFADLDYAAIAAAPGIKPGTVGATLNQAHAALKGQFEEVAR
jgi:RNA polymerase sigma factor (sigma-70 family)